MPTINRDFFKRHRKEKRKFTSENKSPGNQFCHETVYRTKKWQKLRLQKLMDCPLCVMCSQEGKVTPALDVHHIIPILEDPDKAFDPDNLMPLCRMHHIKIHDELRLKKRRQNKEGELTQEDILDIIDSKYTKI